MKEKKKNLQKKAPSILGENAQAHEPEMKNQGSLPAKRLTICQKGKLSNYLYILFLIFLQSEKFFNFRKKKRVRL